MAVRWEAELGPPRTGPGPRSPITEAVWFGRCPWAQGARSWRIPCRTPPAAKLRRLSPGQAESNTGFTWRGQPRRCCAGRFRAVAWKQSCGPMTHDIGCCSPSQLNARAPLCGWGSRRAALPSPGGPPGLPSPGGPACGVPGGGLHPAGRSVTSVGLPSGTPVPPLGPYLRAPKQANNSSLSRLTQPSCRSRHAPFGTASRLAHAMRIPSSDSLDERVFGRRSRCKGPYAPYWDRRCWQVH
jgi:hypothetical protein